MAALLPIASRRVAAVFCSVFAAAVFADGTPAEYGYRVIAAYPHDPSAFTQGLEYHDGFVYESTGRYGASSIRKVELETGRIVMQRRLPVDRFGEGLAIVGNRLIQLTWLAHTGYVYDLDTFELIGQFRYPSEGWGLAYDGQRLLMSDGSDVLQFLDAENFERMGTLRVHDRGRPVNRLNELEFIDGFIYANVWESDRIARIDPRSGQVVAWIDLAGLEPGAGGVLNGIAHRPGESGLLVTGKLWPRLFAVDMVAD